MNRKTQALIVTLCCLALLTCKKDDNNPAQPPETPDYGTPTAVGTLIGSPSTATIGASGGSLLSPDGRSEIIIPAGALSASTQISIQPVTNQAPAGAGVGFSLTPNGQTFTQPVTLRFHYDSTDVAGTSIHALAIATQQDDHIWYSLDTLSLDSAARTVSVHITHFSAYALFKTLEIVPTTATIQPNGMKGIGVKVVQKARTDVNPNDGHTPRGQVVLYPNESEVSWSVNGVDGGDPANGMTSPASASSVTTYTAPDDVHSMFSNPAAVTAEVAVPGSSRLLLVSHIRVSAGRDYRVSIDLVGTNIFLSPYFLFNYSDHAEYAITVLEGVTQVDVHSLVNSPGHIESLTPTGSCIITPTNQGDLLNIHDVVGFTANNLLELHNPSTFYFFPYSYDCGNGTQTSGGTTFEGTYVMPFFPLDSSAYSFTIEGLQTAGEVVTIVVTPQLSPAGKSGK